MDRHAVSIMKSGLRGLQPFFKIIEFSCSICKQDYEKCGHKAGQKYNEEECSVLIKKWDGRGVYVVPKAEDERARITDILEVQYEDSHTQYACGTGFQLTIKKLELLISTRHQPKVGYPRT